MDSISCSREGGPKVDAMIVKGNRAAPQSREELTRTPAILVPTFLQANGPPKPQHANRADGPGRRGFGRPATDQISNVRRSVFSANVPFGRSHSQNSSEHPV